MKTIRRILFAPCALALLTSQAGATDSVTKVGNGDDGTDLEALTPIQSGPIFESRARAVEALKKLNVVGVPGFGLLLPEVERTDLMMAAQDSRPVGEQSGSLEISEDQRLVYARTFAEPYAATRFFPAAQKLTQDQLVALHIHEALHRALPADIRGNEDTVMHLTMAMTSPGASFDRVRKVAGLYIKSPEAQDVTTARRVATAALSAKREDVVIPPRSRTWLGYEFDSFSYEKLSMSGSGMQHGLSVSTSLAGFKAIGPIAVEPVFRARIKTLVNSEAKSHIGASSYELQGRVPFEDRVFAGPLLRFTARALDDSGSASRDRDIFTIGGFYRSENESTYIDSSLTLSLAGGVENGSEKTEYGAIYSLAAHSGLKLGRFRAGGIGELHLSDGKETKTRNYWNYGSFSEASTGKQAPFRLLVLGPELGFVTERFQVKAYGKWIMNETLASLNDLGDPMDRGSDRGGFGSSLSMSF